VPNGNRTCRLLENGSSIRDDRQRRYKAPGGSSDGDAARWPGCRTFVEGSANRKPLNTVTVTMMSSSPITTKENKLWSRLRIFEVAVSVMLIAFLGLLIAQRLLDAK